MTKFKTKTPMTAERLYAWLRLRYGETQKLSVKPDKTMLAIDVGAY